jgi:hypothetical protein
LDFPASGARVVVDSQYERNESSDAGYIRFRRHPEPQAKGLALKDETRSFLAPLIRITLGVAVRQDDIGDYTLEVNKGMLVRQDSIKLVFTSML